MTVPDAAIAAARRVERIGDATLLLGDCLTLMPLLTANSVHVLWTDPPYGHANHDGDWNARLNEHRGIEGKPIANDDNEGMRRVVDGMLTAAVRLLDEDCCCCGGGPKPTFAWVADRMDRQGLSFFHSVIWDKRNPGLGWRYRRQHEMVMIAHREGGTLRWQDDAKAVRNIYSCMPPRERQHPNEKPVGMVADFLEWHSYPGDMILDPFMGSGTTGVAALSMGRKFIGIELDEQWFDVACERVGKSHQSPSFLAPPKPAPAVQQPLFSEAAE